MSIQEVIIIAVGLAMDAFAVCIVIGLSNKGNKLQTKLKVSFLFAFFQGAFPIIGFYIGNNFQELIQSFNHWVAFGVLAFLGIKMVKESFDNKNFKINTKDLKKVISLNIATSIDAFTIGITFAFFNNNIFSSSLTIAAVTFMLCFVGIEIGRKFGRKNKKKAEVFGGFILILIGVKILAEHFLI